MQNLPCKLMLIIALVIPSFVASQNNKNPWTLIKNQDLLQKENVYNQVLPERYKSFQLEQPLSLKIQLDSAPLLFSERSNQDGILIDIPLPDGSFEKFKVYESPVMSPTLSAKFPEIKTYTASGISTPGAVAKIDFTTQGFHAMVYKIGYNPIFVNPYNVEEGLYMSFYKKDYPKPGTDFQCDVGSAIEIEYGQNEIITKVAGDCQLREYRLALACTGEYAEFHDDGDDTNGDIVDDAMAAMVISMNRVNGVFERDAGLTMVMVDNNEDIIFTNGATDPYSNGNGGAMLGQNQTTCDNVIGSANYDIGHVFSTGGGGVAYLGAPCNNSIKAGGVTGQNSPIGDPFDIDYVAHEMGHQFGGSHTQNNSCNRSSGSSYEPGSASTIMGYAGICNPNVQSNSDDYFHARSILQMGNFTTGNGNDCATIIDSNNNQPDADAGSNYTIPISTPFVLSGSATDVDTDPLTYCWEQYDDEVANMPPESTSTSGPAFRSFTPVSSPDRYCPRLSVLAESGTDTWEVLPSVSRSMDFRLTVRDNNSAYGCTDEDDMTVTTSASAGPFVIVSPDAALEWDAGETKTIIWDVANTNQSPVNCNNVDIYYSTNGGISFPNLLLSNVSNDGSQDIIVPDVTTSSFRIMVKCSDNIFFNVTNENITIGDFVTICEVFTSTDVPKSISDSGTPTITSEVSITLGDQTISDINILNLEGTHTYLGDLRFRLAHPGGTEVTLIDRECGNDNDFDVNIDDDGGALSCPYNNNETSAPDGTLTLFNGLLSDGDWILEIADLANQDGGELTAWSVEVCYDEPEINLPVDFIRFDAFAKKQSIQLIWETANELDNSGFNIQRSTSPQDGFENIEWIEGKGEALEAFYQYEDTDVKAGVTYYYRLEQVDYNGKTDFSEIRTARILADELHVLVSPNPSRGDFNIDITKDGYFEGNVEVIDLLGRVVQAYAFDMKDYINLNINGSNLSNGVYFINISLSGDEARVIKIVKE